MTKTKEKRETTFDKRDIIVSVMPSPKAIPNFGFLPPLFKFAECAKERGYNVTWCCSNFVKQRIVQNHPQDDIRTYPDSTVMGLPGFVQPMLGKLLNANLPQWMLPKLKKEEDSEWLFDSYIIIGMGSERFFSTAVLETLKAIFEKKPAFLFTYGCPVGAVAAHISGIPVVKFDNLMEVKDKGGKNTARLNKTVKSVISRFSPYKEDPIPFEKIYRNDKQFRIISTVEKLGQESENERTVYIGGFEPHESRLSDSVQTLQDEDLKKQRVVFGYFGTGSISVGLVKKVLPGVFEEVNRRSKEPYHCYVGSHFVKEQFDIGTVHFAPFYDANKLLKYAEFTFSHGGINTILQSLTFGVPLILVPGSIYERRFNSKEVVAVKSGVLVEIQDFTVDYLTRLILDKTRVKDMQENARIIKNRVDQSGGIDNAFEKMQTETKWLREYDYSKMIRVMEHMKNNILLPGI